MTRVSTVTYLTLFDIILAEEPMLANVETYLCRNPKDLEFTLDNLADTGC